jgi:hypothetical protein
MKTLLLFYCLFFLLFDQVNAAESQDTTKITIHFKNQPLDSALYQLERQSGHSFVYQDKIAGKSSKVNRKFEDKSLSQILDILLAKTENSYVIVWKQVTIYKTRERMAKTTQDQKTMLCSIEGVVIDENGDGVLGASVAVKKEQRVLLKKEDYKTYAITDKNGTFVISIDDPDAQLLVNHVGYYPQIVYPENAAWIKLKPYEYDENEIITVGCAKRNGQVNASESQDTTSLTVRLKNQSLDSALVQLERLSGLIFVYQDKVASKSPKVNRKFENKPLSEILDVLFAKTNNRYVFLGRRVIIYHAMEEMMKTVPGQVAAPFSIEGKVIDENGDVVMGASVYLKTGNIIDWAKSSAHTDKNGAFVISTDNPNALIVVIFVAYYPQVVHVKDATLIELKRDIELDNMIIKVGVR